MNLAINGFGRIGRLALRVILKRFPHINVVALNDLTDARTLAHLFKYDSVHGRWAGDVGYQEDNIILDDKTIKIFSEKDPAKLPWYELKVDLVLECTGLFRSREKAGWHIQAGAGKVLLSVPAKDKIDATIVLGVNEHQLQSTDRIVSNASCTTNCLAPICKVLNDHFGIENGIMTTVHSYTNDQRILDLPHPDLRRARAAAVNMIPTTTGAARAIGLVIPELAGKLDGVAVRVPTPDASLVDLSVLLKQETNAVNINQVMKKEAEGRLKGILEYSELPLVSVDIIGNPHSSVFDAEMTSVQGKLAKVFSWYDNEFGYSCRLVELADLMMKK